MQNHIHQWQGSIRLKAKSANKTNYSVIHDTFNFGEYEELKETVVLDTWGDPHFGELRFKTKTKLAGLEEIRYLFNPGHNATDTENVFFFFEIQHVFFTTEKCMLFCNEDVYVNDLIEKNDENELDPFAINIICEFENKDNLGKTLRHLCRANKIPFWDQNFMVISGSESNTSGNLAVKGNIRLVYQQSFRYMCFQDNYYYKVILRTNRPAQNLDLHLIIQKLYRDFDMLFSHPRAGKLVEISTEHQARIFNNFISNDGNKNNTSFLIQHTLLMGSFIFFMGKIKFESAKNEIDVYDCCIKLSSSNNRLEQLCFSFDIKPSEYWNLEEIDLKKLINN